MDGADEARALRIVAKDLTNLPDQHVQAAVDDECVRPEPLVEFGLVDDLRPRLDQTPQEIERLRREMALRLPAQQLTRTGVDGEWTEHYFHGCAQSLTNPYEFL